MKPINIYTTPTIEGQKIIKSLGIVTANQVAGTGFFSDFAASLSDFFGGNSGVYRDSMSKLYKNVEDQLKLNASKMGADAIVNVRIDFDNISAKNMSMFMASAQGTAVILEEKVKEVSKEPFESVTPEDINTEMLVEQFKRNVDANTPVSNDILDNIIENKSGDLQLIEYMVKYYLYCSRNSDSEFGPKDMIKALTFLSSIPYNDLVEYIYKLETINSKLIKDLRVFNAKEVLKIAQNGNLELACALLACDKESYNQNDIAEMQNIVDFFDNLPSIRHEEIEKGGLFSSEKKVIKCSCGKHVSGIYCEYCNKNEKGLTSYDEKCINRFKYKLSVIKKLLS